MRIVIAEDDFLVREGLALMLRAESLDVVATASNPDDFLAAVGAHRPDLARRRGYRQQKRHLPAALLNGHPQRGHHDRHHDQGHRAAKRSRHLHRK